LSLGKEGEEKDAECEGGGADGDGVGVGGEEVGVYVVEED
jgi:hypothetical protein